MHLCNYSSCWRIKKANTTYTGTTTFLNEAVKPADDITAEVKEGETTNYFIKHQQQLELSPTEIPIKNGKPIGLTFTLENWSNSYNGKYYRSFKTPTS